MRILILLFYIFSLNSISYSQVKSLLFNKQAVIVEVLGNARSIVSTNYERIFKMPKKDHLYFAARTGLGYNPGVKSIDLKSTISVPVVVSLLWGKKKHFIQLKVGYTATFGQSGVDSTVSPAAQYLKYESAFILNAGYRFMEYKGAMFELIPLMLVWTNNPTSRFMFSFGFSIGGAF